MRDEKSSLVESLGESLDESLVVSLVKIWCAGRKADSTFSEADVATGLAAH